MDGFAYNLLGAIGCLVLMAIEIYKLVKTRDIRFLSMIGLYLFGGMLFVAYKNPILEGVMAFSTLACLVIALVAFKRGGGSDDENGG